ncbi:MAG: hypothetical protein WCY65_02265, partial [Candidatus Methanomethylophilaceae archaeon]
MRLEMREFVRALRQRTGERLMVCPPAEKLLVLLLIFVILYGGCLALSMHSLGSDPQNYPDLPFYQERTSSALAGEIPYRDLSMESPPLIVYMMVPAQLMGGDLVHYGIWFSFVSFLGAVACYLLLRRVDESSAFLGSLLFLIHPATISTSSINIQDESVIAVLIVLSLSLLVLGFWRSALAISVAGVAAKAFTAFLIPYMLISEGERDRLIRGGALLLLVTALVTAPFLLLAPEQFLAFPEYYISQALGGGVTDGMSLWRFLTDAGVSIPSSSYLMALLASYALVL